MEWFWQMMDHLQKSATVATLQSFSYFDWIFLIVILVGLAQGSRKGFSEMFGKLLGIFLVSMLTMSFYEKGAESLTANLAGLPVHVAQACSFFLLSVVFWLSSSWALNVFGKFFKVEAQGFLKSFGGMVFGVFRMILLLSFLVQFLLFFPIAPVQQLFKPGQTYTGYTVARVAPELHTLIVNLIHKPAVPKPVGSHPHSR